MKSNVKLPLELSGTTTRDEGISGIRFGKILDIDMDKSIVWVDYPGNPTKDRIAVKSLASGINLEILEEALVRKHKVEIEFIAGSPTKPILKDIYFSVVDQIRHSREEIVEKTVVLKADKIILEGTTEISLKCGDTEITLNAEDGTLVEKAEDIRSVAKREHRLQGGKVYVN